MLISSINKKLPIIQMTTKAIRLSIMAIAALVVICFYFIYSPAESTLFPKCVFHWLTGFECPACGLQRALHALLHGEIAEAYRYNPFACISIPYLTILLICRFSKRYATGRLSAIAGSRFLSYTYMVLFFVWWIVRNII